jgi:6-phosphogluconolactonase/glucosamine-6-phosphate isomerase/deaminase
VLLATGAGKADAVDAMLGDESRHVPASLLRRERLTVIADDLAAPPPVRS